MDITTDQKNMETVSISINGMHCMGCVNKIQDLISQLNGVDHVEVSLDEAKAEVKFAPATISVQQLGEHVKAAGYQVGETTSILKSTLPDISRTGKACCCS